MSYSHWGIIGYGIDLDDIQGDLDQEKVNLLVRELNPLEHFDEDVFEDDTFCGNPYMSFEEFLYELDETKSLGWEDGGESDKHYFLYEPKYPWQITNRDPMTAKEVEDRIINVLTKVYNTSEEDIRSKIGEINDYGCG